MSAYGTRQTIAHQKECLPAGATYLRKVDNNTIEFVTATGETGWLLHETVIAVGRPNEQITLFNGGFKTPTTKDRLNKALHRFGFRSLGICQDRGRWYLFDYYDRDGQCKVRFTEGMTIKKTDIGWDAIGGEPVDDEREARLNKQIAQYCKAIAKLPALPEPDNGDCWSCLFGWKDCLESHLEEQYIHGSLIMQALIAKRYWNPGFIFQVDRRPYPMVTRAVRDYFKKGLGL